MCVSLTYQLLLGTKGGLQDIYYQAFPNDRPRTKFVVYAMYILELLQTVLITHDAFADLGFGFGDPSSLFQIRLGWFTVPILSSLGIFSSSQLKYFHNVHLVALIGQFFYAYRLYVLSESYIIPVVIVLVRVFTFLCFIRVITLHPDVCCK